MNDSIEQQVQAIGRSLLTELRAFSEGFWSKEHWIAEFAGTLIDDETLRTQVLRFIDVLPALSDDRDLVRHLHAYFRDVDLPAPMLANWGLQHTGGAIGAHVAASAVRTSVSALARNFIGGENADQIGRTATKLWKEGYLVSIDLLGEEAVSEAEADALQRKNSDLLQQLSTFLHASRHEAERNHRADLSIKCSSFYSQLGRANVRDSVEALKRRIRPLLVQAMQSDISVTFDMEQYDLRHVVLQTFRELLMEDGFRGWDGAGIALQSYLKETHDDLQALIAWARQRETPVNVRLVRGAYWDSEVVIAGLNNWEVPVWSRKEQSDAAYESCLELLFANHQLVRPVVATHNVRSHAVALALAGQHQVDPGGFEFQVLYGMGAHLARVLKAQGVGVRIYTPAGELIPGMSYLVRRLLENTTGHSFIQQSLSREFNEELLEPPDSSAAGGRPHAATLSQSDGFHNEPLHRFVKPHKRKQFAAAIEDISGMPGIRVPLLINGRERFTGQSFSSRNPADPGTIIGECARASSDDVDEAIASARRAAAQWSGATVEVRSKKLLEIARRLRRSRDTFAAWEIFEVGKSWQEADADVAEAIDFLEYYASEALRLFKGETIALQGEMNRVEYQARGIVVVIPPWNFPLAILTGMLSAALVTGNCVILKPSSDSPVIAWKLIELLRDCGLPDGAVNFLPGPGEQVGEQLVRHPAVDMIAFTGSRAVGCRIVELAARVAGGQTHLKHVVAEMGGKNAIIIDRDADLDAAVKGVIHSAFGYQGQKCSAASRVIVVGAVKERFVKRLVEAAASIRMGPPTDPANRLGPVISEQAYQRIQRVIEAGKQVATLRLQREPDFNSDGYYIGPVIFSGVDPDSFLAQEEIFGPVLSIIDADSFEEAITVANATSYALTGGVYSRDPAHLDYARTHFKVGNLYLNRGITGALVGRQPFGGFKLSGTCNKTGGRDYLLQFIHARTVTENTLRRGFAPALESDHG
ncbi:MAG: proline dehydrogenase family protein [Pseudomonadota bacterium]